MSQISYNQNIASQITEPNSPYIKLYGNDYNISLFLQIDNLLNSLTQSIQSISKYNNIIICTNVMTTIEDFSVLKKINYICIALCQESKQKMGQNLLWQIYRISHNRKGQIKYGNLSGKHIWKSIRLDEYLDYRSSLKAYPWINNVSQIMILALACILYPLLIIQL